MTIITKTESMENQELCPREQTAPEDLEIYKFEHIDIGLTIPTAALFIVGQVVGSGVVAVPNALANTGWIGLVLMFVSAVGNGFVSVVITNCLKVLGQRNPRYVQHIRDPYSTIMEQALGRRVRLLAGVLFHILIITAITVYLLVSSALLSDFVNSFISNFEGPNEFRVWVVIFAILLTPLTLYGTPKEFWGVALMAVLTTGISVVLIIVALILHHDSETRMTLPVLERHVTWRSFFSGLGTILFAFAGAPFFPALQTDMKVKTNFPKAVCWGYLTISILYIPMGIYGYVVLGDGLYSNILTNLVKMQEPCHGCKGLVYTCQFLMGGHFILGYLLLFNPMAQEIEEHFAIPRHFCWQRCLVRSLLVLGTVLIAEVIPDFNIFLSLVGGTLITTLTYVLPVLAYIRLEPELPLYMKVLLWELVGVSFICVIGSLYSSVVDVISIY